MHFNQMQKKFEGKYLFYRSLFSLMLWTSSTACYEWCIFHCLISDTDPHLSNFVNGINFPKLTNLGRNEMKCCFSCGKMKEAIKELNIGKSH